MLELRNLTKRITLHILGGAIVEPFTDISFDVGEGEFVAIVGPSGSGKSSVIKTVYRTYLATTGTALYRTAAGDSVNLASAPDRTVIKLRHEELGFVSQFLKVEPRVPAIQIVARPLVRKGVDEAKALSRASELLERLDVPERLWRSYPSLFSGGEQQRINIARALISEPRLLIADEPTSALDSTNTGRVIEALMEARQRGLTVLGVFHDLDLIERVADRVVVMGNGRITAQGRVGEVEIPRLTTQQEFAPRV
jgi:alpha-D-ribose 1-methylphosphonate 5-triphosphate synthase subunit PhnL